MKEIYAPIVDQAATIGTAVGSTFFTVGGLLIEHAGVKSVLAGQATLGIWELWMGTLALFVGVYLLGYQKFWQQLRR